MKPLEVLYEDNHLIVVNKPAGLLVQGDQTGDLCLIDAVKNYLKIKYNKPGAVFAGLIHRLDRPTSGCVVLAKTSKALTRMNKLFATRAVEKIYWALVSKSEIATQGTLTHWLKKNQEQNKSFAYPEEQKDSKLAKLHYQTIQQFDRYQLLEIRLETGRHHQIRAQMAAVGLPLKGDLKYGAPRPNKDGSIDLHARKIRFEHPVKKEWLTITAPLPNRSVWNSFVCD